MIAGVVHGGGPADENFVVVADGVVDGKFEIGEGAEEALVKGEEGIGADEVGTVFGDAVGNAAGGEEFGDGGGAALVPDFVEPAFHQGDVGVGHGWLLVAGMGRMVPLV